MNIVGKWEKMSGQNAEQEKLNKLLGENKRLQIQFSTTSKQVRELNEFIQIMLHMSPFGTCIIQGDKIIFANKTFAEVFEVTPGQLRKHSLWDMIFEDDLDLVRKNMDAILQAQSSSFFMFRVTAGEEKIKWILGSLALIHMNEKRAVLGNFVDLTEGRVMQFAFTDPLTGLSNRKLMMDRLEQAIVSAKRRNDRVAVLFLDLDDFKKVNDTYGHKTGDQLLMEIAGRLREIVRRENDTIARIGGDEFCILLTGISHKSQVETVIGHLFERFIDPLPVGEQLLNLKVNLSVGVAMYPLHGTDPDALIRNADSAMYRAKKIEKNRFCFYDPERMSCGKNNRKKARSS
jgi:diguanylate cyclase (GGDEF)-like protein/PAS domain S-box-containing protein